MAPEKSDLERPTVRLGLLCVKDLLSGFHTHKTACPGAHRSLRYAHEVPTDPPRLRSWSDDDYHDDLLSPQADFKLTVTYLGKRVYTDNPGWG